ncbi:MAG: hypothetical protein JKY71_07705 [Alphaproteobacteria bacterium]|jgi:hypothetical protein|uniref:hypothetical protein n=1 Tax=uncultured Henriciella sp. TaxID=1608424 RepID=UPI000C5ED5A9|nr:hypothetical protein [Henriciella sp.]MBF35581.1 hypothetical protein [Hyphomonadaceae bacterium]MBL4804735.1 hypothetical protein [Alphaproteobacteria bacterium]|tara:strand:+ start:2234 stop:2674 length:441 start_codon:yes stop_codon:yes gene_type:complete
MLTSSMNDCASDFTVSAGTPARIRKKHPSPISLRLTHEEREQLERDAGDMTLSRYIRARLFPDGTMAQCRNRPKRKTHKPCPDHVLLARVLGLLGSSDMAVNLARLADAAEIGALPVTDEVQEELSSACGHVQSMRNTLMQAISQA